MNLLLKTWQKIQDTDIFVYNDENMETWVPAIQKTLQEGNVHTIKATEGMLLLPGSEEGHDHDHEHGGRRPYTRARPTCMASSKFSNQAGSKHT